MNRLENDVDVRPDAAIAGNLVQWDHCSSHKDCDSCLNASLTCHFCQSDFQCHTIGSPYGCPVGVSVCHHLEDCKRSDPQFVGYGPPPYVVVAVLGLMVMLTCCFCGISIICSVFCRDRKASTRRAALTAGLHDDKRTKKHNMTIRDDAEETQTQRQPLLLGEIREGEILLFENEVNWKALATRVTWLTVLISMTVLALMFYPRMPDYNVCNREFEWESILHSIMGLEPKVEYQVLVSVINENRFGFVLESGRADIYHNATLVGKWELHEPLEAKAGSISDVIAEINIKPGFAEGIALWKDFSKNELIFRINATIAGSITWGRYKIYRISSSTPDVEFLVGAEYDRGLCKCTEYLTPT
ncbi:unnamed protein product [Peronospora destructor]|uniref:PSI domain-containing protein n=1 Tax=Peronospora destructor TaxID=86335 RepID=A0AAV0U6D3_9STRA|nr:unnamed protein product [Peronospora destructor]